VLAGMLLVLAWRIFRGDPSDIDPSRNVFVRLARRVFPVTDEHAGARLLVRRGGKVYATPAFLCLAAIVFTDVAFALDSIPAAFGITRDGFLIWTANAFALLGLRALFVLVEGMVERFRYLDEAIAVVLVFVAGKLVLEDVYEVLPAVSLAVVIFTLGAGVMASLLVDRREGRRGEGAA
jgi:tellurite resistance protein TerC